MIEYLVVASAVVAVIFALRPLMLDRMRSLGRDITQELQPTNGNDTRTADPILDW